MAVFFLKIIFTVFFEIMLPFFEDTTDPNTTSEILRLARQLGVGIVERGGEAHTLHRCLTNAVDRRRHLHVEHIEHRGHEVDSVGELGPHFAAGTDPLRPVNNQRCRNAPFVGPVLIFPKRGIGNIGPVFSIILKLNHVKIYIRKIGCRISWDSAQKTMKN